VVSPAGTQHAAGLIEGLSLADLIAEEFGLVPEPSRSARRAARSVGAESITDQAAVTDPTDARLAALERTVRQLEHALSARVATERAIGVLAERTGTGPRTAFERLRGEARNSGRPVAEIAREVMATLPADPVYGSDSAAADGVH
jgi:hypothetical protein